MEQSSLQIDILLLPPQKTSLFEINKKQHTRILNDASFPLGVPLRAALIVCVPICTHEILFQEAVNSVTHYFSLFDFTETAWYSKKLASFPRKSLHNSRFYDHQCTGEKEEDYNQHCFSACALVNPSFQKLLETVA